MPVEIIQQISETLPPLDRYPLSLSSRTLANATQAEVEAARIVLGTVAQLEQPREFEAVHAQIATMRKPLRTEVLFALAIRANGIPTGVFQPADRRMAFMRAFNEILSLHGGRLPMPVGEDFQSAAIGAVAYDEARFDPTPVRAFAQRYGITSEGGINRLEGGRTHGLARREVRNGGNVTDIVERHGITRPEFVQLLRGWAMEAALEEIAAGRDPDELAETSGLTRPEEREELRQAAQGNV